MSKRHLSRTIVAATITGSLILTGGSMAAAAPANAVGASSHAPAATGTNHAASLRAPGQPSAPAATSEATPQAVPAIVIRVAVRAGLQTLKRVNKAWYNAILAQVTKGRTAFVHWWNTKVPSSVKGVFGGLSAGEIYDVLVWLFGLA